MSWRVDFTKKAEKQYDKLHTREQDLVILLIKDLKKLGPVVPQWPHYSKLEKTNYHCHLNYRWVACWKVEDKTVQLIEIYYVGSRENAPY